MCTSTEYSVRSMSIGIGIDIGIAERSCLSGGGHFRWEMKRLKRIEGVKVAL